MKNEITEKNILDSIGVVIDSDTTSYDDHKNDYIEVDSSIAGRLDSAMQFIPEVLLNQALSEDVYRVRFNKGIGVLQKAADNPGLYRANVVSPLANNDIRGQALLQSLSTSPQIISGVFSAMSIVTGQYYMSQITDSLRSIEKQVQSIQKFLEDDKRSSLEAYEQFLRNTQIEHQSIIQNACLRQSTLTNIQKIKIDSLSAIIFDRKQVNDLKDIDIKKDKIKEVASNMNRISDLIFEYWFSLYLYIYSSSMEILISQHFDQEYITDIKEDICKKCEQYKEDESLWRSEMERYITSAKAFGDNKAINLLKMYGENAFFMGPFQLGPKAVKVVADLADEVDKSIKNNKQKEIYNSFKMNTENDHIKILDAKMDEISLLDTLYNSPVELINNHGVFYISNPSLCEKKLA